MLDYHLSEFLIDIALNEEITFGVNVCDESGRNHKTVL